MTDFDDYPGRNEPTRWEVFKYFLKKPWKLKIYLLFYLEEIKEILKDNIFWRKIK